MLVSVFFAAVFLAPDPVLFLVFLVTAVVTLEHSDWLAGEMSLNLIYDFGPVSEIHLECLGEGAIKKFCSCRVLADAKEHDIMSPNDAVE